ncbi:protein RRP5 homolog isoform X2 [Lepisosteus oculatus]|uniref:protein RRP5 homolog isoform X2 n=1 Tax=Lepisosteus oculatus TaxID=7918 RepID=UPI003723C95C
MASVEEDFPRGGKVKRAEGSQPVRNHVEQDNLFEARDPEEGKKRKKKRTEEEKTSKKRMNREEETLKLNASKNVEILHLRNVTVGTLLLGCVKEVNDFELVVSLPSGLTGFVQITNISDSYTKLLSEQLDSAQSLEETLTLPRLFPPGMLLRCVVSSVEVTKGGHQSLKLSVNPREVNKALGAGSLKAGMLISGSVESIEDHGYLVDIGVSGAKAFLPRQKAKDLQLESKGGLMVGQYLNCLLEEVKNEGRIVRLSVGPSEIAKAVADTQQGWTLNSLLPGLIVKAKVKKVTIHGPILEFLSSFTGTVDFLHIDSEKASDYTPGDTVKACVLYIDPSTRTVGLSLRPHLLHPGSKLHTVSNTQIGEVVQDCKVKSFHQHSGAILKLPDGSLVFAHKNHLKESHESFDPNRTLAGSTHTCRILDFSPLEQMLLVSLRKSVIEAPFLQYQDLQPGQLVTGIVTSLHDFGMLVKVTEHIRGMVPRTHLADIILKNPEKKYRPGDEVKCRVLTVDPKVKNLVLTRKKTLVESTLPLICTYQDAKPGQMSHCYIVSVKDFGCIVRFYGNVKGLVPVGELSMEPKVIPEKLFYVGQVVKAKVMKCDPHQEKLLLSFKGVAEDIQTVPEESSFEYEVGKTVEARIVQKTDSGLKVSILPEEAAAFLPTVHLSDHVSNCSLLWEGLREGDIISNVVCLSKSKEQIILSKKPSLKAVFEDGVVARNFAELNAGMLLAGWIKNVMSYGVFVEFPYGLVGLAPISAMSDKFVTNTGDAFKVGQTVVAKVTNLDEEKRRFLVTLKVSEVSLEREEAAALLSQCIQERNTVAQMMANQGHSELLQSLSSLKVGQKLKLTVDEVNDNGTATFKADHLNGVTILASKYHLTGVTVVEGQKVTGVILHVDFLTRQLHISLSPLLVSSKCKLKANVTMPATLQYVERDFAVIRLGETGHLTFISTKTHWNDTFRFESERLSVGQCLTVTVKKPKSEELGGFPSVTWVSGKIVGSRRERSLSQSKDEKLGGPKHPFSLGDTVKGTIKTIRPLSVLVALEGGITGSIHVSEVLEQVKPGTFPVSTLTKGSTVTARVIGGREVRSHKFLPISHPNFTFTIPELTLLPSKMEGDLPTQEEHAEALENYQPGQEVTCFVYKYNTVKKCLEVDVTPVLGGKVDLLLMSLTPKELKHPEKLCKLGQALKATVVSTSSCKTKLVLSLTGLHSLTNGSITLGTVAKIVKRVGLVVSLPFGHTGRVSVLDLDDCYRPNPLDSYHVGQVVRCYIVESEENKLQLSLRRSRTTPGSSQVVKDPEIPSIADLKEGQRLRGYVTSIKDCGVFISLSRSIIGRAQFHHVTKHFTADHSVFVKHIPLNSLLTTKVLSIDKEKGQVELSLLPEDTGGPDVLPESLGLPLRMKVEETTEDSQKKRKRQTSESEQEAIEKSKKKKKKKTSGKSEENDSGVEVYFREDEEENKKLPSKKAQPAQTECVSPQRLHVSSGFSWDTGLSTLRPATVDPVADSSSEEEEENTEKKAPKKSKRDKEEERQREERELTRLESEMMDPGRRPRTSNDFDRLVLSSPNSSLVWLQYMAFHLQATEIEQARAVAERALKTISFREEQEKLNVWVAFLNLENMYGTEESLQKVFKRAVQYCEPMAVFQQLADIYTKSNKHKEADSLYNTMLKRFRQEKSVWLSYGTFLLKQGGNDAAHRLLQRALRSLPNKEHVDVIAKFAQLEFQYGDVERAKAMFDSTLSSYPKRTDLWSVYIDLLIKHGSQKEVRNVFERVIHLSLAAKKIKFFFKRYLEYEKKHGSAETVEAVKAKALEYVEARGSVADS